MFFLWREGTILTFDSGCVSTEISLYVSLGFEHLVKIRQNILACFATLGTAPSF